MQALFHNFWKVNPALLIGLYLLLGGAMALEWHDIFLLPSLLLLLLSPSPIKGSLILTAFFIYVKILYPTPEFKEATGVGHFSIASLKIHPTPFNRTYAYTGILKTFTSQEGLIAENIPCKVFLPLKKERAIANQDYQIKGTLKIKEKKFKIDKKSAWDPIPNTFSLAEWRFQTKERFKRYLKLHLKDNRVSSFLSTLTTGDLDERSLSFEFGKLGLQHILAISGFHFGLLALFLGFIFRLLFSLRTAALLLLIFLTAYFLFIGNSPSVQRAWIALSIFLIGYLCKLRSSPLNALGLAFIIELLLSPLVLKEISFQLSFAATLAILLLYSPFNHFLTAIFPKRPLNLLVKMSRFHQHGYLLSALLRKSLALNCSVHLLTLPILLFLFSKFPLLSLLYNLFFPFWVTLSFLLLLLSLPFPFLHTINNPYTSLLLDVTSHPPALLNYQLHTPPFSLTLLTPLLTLLFLTSIYLHTKAREKIIS